MKRYNSEADDKQLLEHPESEGEEIVSIAYTSPQFHNSIGHWRIVWNCETGLRVLEAIEYGNEVVYRDSIRLYALSKTLREYKYTHIKKLGKDSREALVTIASSMDKSLGSSQRCRWFIREILIKAIELGIFSENEIAKAMLDSGIHNN